MQHLVQLMILFAATTYNCLLQKWMVAWVLKWPRKIGQVLWVDSFRVKSERGTFSVLKETILSPQSQNTFLFSKI